MYSARTEWNTYEDTAVNIHRTYYTPARSQQTFLYHKEKAALRLNRCFPLRVALLELDNPIL
jgi:hypothetical protein